MLGHLHSGQGKLHGMEHLASIYFNIMVENQYSNTPSNKLQSFYSAPFPQTIFRMKDALYIINSSLEGLLEYIPTSIVGMEADVYITYHSLEACRNAFPQALSQQTTFYNDASWGTKE